ncbi:MAG: FAD-dependent monooxygenase [Bacteroidetes bacterium]|nr:FAD-dependent monooxygenase [Bacteroidota bacterium]
MENKVCIVGAGLVGSLLANYMAKRSIQVDMFERRPDMRRTDIPAGRSINLAMSDRGWRALEVVGAEETIRELAIPMHGRLMHDVEGNTHFMPYGKEGQYINSVSRGELNMRLLSLAEKTGKVNTYFDERCTNVDLDNGTLTFTNENTGVETTNTYDRIFGADGAFSAIRNAMMRRDRFNYSQYYITSGYKELTMPPVPEKKWAIDNGALHIWPRKDFMLIALPNLDGSFTCTLFMPFDGEEGFDNLKTHDQVQAFFEKYFPDALQHMPTLLEDWDSNATSPLMTVSCNPWNHKGKFLLMGDAAHAVVPFYGQGMIAGFEGVRILNEMLDKYENWDVAFEEYSKYRQPDGDGIRQLALDNYREMRDLVADEHFIRKRQLSGKIHEIFGENWMPLYTMVTFSHVRYSEAYAKGQWQNKVLNELVATGLSKDSSEAEIKAAVMPYLKVTN